MCMYSQAICMFISAEIDYGITSIKYYFRIAYVYPIFNDKNVFFPVKRILVQSSIVDFSGLTYTVFS